MPSLGKRLFKAVLFDLDGTLIEFKFKVNESRESMIETLSQMGFETSRLNRAMKTQAIIDNAEEQWKASQALHSRYRFEDIKSKLSDLLDEYEFQAFDEAKPHPGSLDVLKTLRSQEILTGVVTNSGRAPVDTLLEKFGFAGYLSLVITRDELSKLKPEPEGILRAMQLLGVGNEETAYVGDSIIDVQAAKTAKVTAVAVASGLYQAESLSEQNPDFLIHKIEDLQSIVFSETL